MQERHMLLLLLLEFKVYIMDYSIRIIQFLVFFPLTWHFVTVKVLGVSEEPCCLSDELHEVHHLPHFPSLPLHRCLRAPWHAALRWQVTITGHEQVIRVKY